VDKFCIQLVCSHCNFSLNSKILFDVTECRSFTEKHTTYSQVFTPHDWLLLTLCPIWPEPLLVIPLKSPFSVWDSLYQMAYKCSITIRLYSRDSSSAQITSFLFSYAVLKVGQMVNPDLAEYENLMSLWGIRVTD
jgi:hypothetical protein